MITTPIATNDPPAPANTQRALYSRYPLCRNIRSCCAIGRRRFQDSRSARRSRSSTGANPNAPRKEKHAPTKMKIAPVLTSAVSPIFDEPSIRCRTSGKTGHGRYRSGLRDSRPIHHGTSWSGQIGHEPLAQRLTDRARVDSPAPSSQPLELSTQRPIPTMRRWTFGGRNEDDTSSYAALEAA